MVGEGEMWRQVVPDVIRQSYAAKLGIGFVVILLVVGGLGGIIYLTTGDVLAADAEAEMQGTAEQHADQLNRWATNSRHTAQRVAESNTVASGSTSDIAAYFDSLVTEDGLTSGARAIHYVNSTTTEILASSLEDRVGGNPHSEGAPWAQTDLTAMRPDEVMVTAFNPTVTNATVMTFVTPVSGQNRAVVYVTSLAGVTATLHQPSEEAFTTVVDENGKTIINQHNTSAVGTQHITGEGVDSTAVERGLDGGSGFVSMAPDETPASFDRLVMGYDSVESVNWVVMTHAPASEIFALKQMIGRNLLVLLGATLVGLAGLGLTLGRNTLSALDRLTAKAREMENGTLDVTLQIRREDEIGQLFGAFDSMRNSLRETIRDAEDARERAEEAQQEAESAREQAETERERSEALVDHLEEKAAAYQRVMEAAADGDLTRRMDPESESEAMTEIATAFNEMVAALATTVDEIQEFADDVAASSEAVTTSTEEIQTASREVSESVQTISVGAEEQTTKLREVSGEMQNLSGSIEEIASSSDQVTSTVATAASEGRKGQEAATDAIEAMDDIEAVTDRTVDEVETLVDEIHEITEIVEMIGDIAEQTNLLALNASIEAAHADDAGDGFGVVADEIKGLAMEATDATADIESRIADIQSSSTATVEGIQAMRERVDEGTATVEDALVALEDVAEHIEEANTGVQEINDATDDQAASTEEVVTMVDDVAGVAADNSAEAEDVSAATEEQTSALTEVSSDVQSLSQRATDLQALLSEFETDESSSPSPSNTGGSVSTVSDGGERIDRESE